MSGRREIALLVSVVGSNDAGSTWSGGRARAAAGERVASSPAGINVAVSSSGSASFATGTTITLRTTNERDVIWSGDCSSGGNKTKTCTFTLNGDASVTANVQ